MMKLENFDQFGHLLFVKTFGIYERRFQFVFQKYICQKFVIIKSQKKMCTQPRKQTKNRKILYYHPTGIGSKLHSCRILFQNKTRNKYIYIILQESELIIRY